MGKQMEVIRPQYLVNNIAIVDGFSGTGKSLMMPLLSHLKNGEVWQLLMETERVCLLQYLNKVDYNAAKALVKMHFDQRIYELYLGRNVNFRASDDSSVQGNLLKSKYKKRVQDASEREVIVDKIEREKPLLVMDAHYIFGFTDLYMESFDESLGIYLFMVRNPAHLINAYFLQNIDSRVGHDPMEMTLCVEIDGNTIPYYAVEYHKEYLAANNLEKAILFVCHYQKMVDKMYATLTKKQKKKFLFVSFENFTTNPKPFMKKIKNILKTKNSTTYKKMYKFLDMPRKKEKIDYDTTYKLAKQQNITIKKKYKKMLDELISDYKIYLSKETK